jgi:hypothetical protein
MNRVRINFLLVMSAFGSGFAVAAQSQGTFTPAGFMLTPRAHHTATLLNNGKVLITGGHAGRSAPNPSNTAELFDPATGTSTPLSNMTASRLYHSAVVLPDRRVLIVSGFGEPSAEVFDPATGRFTAIGNPQYGGRATLLNNAKVLLTGGVTPCPNGRDGCGISGNPELYDPITGKFALTGDWADRRADPWFETAGLSGPTTVLRNGEVLVAAEPVAELYNPATGTFRVAGQMTRGNWLGNVPGWQIGGTATLLPNGNVLLTGGEFFEGDWFTDAELYDASMGKFTAIGNMRHARSSHTATLLDDGRVLIAGGRPNCHFEGRDLRCESGTAEIYDPATVSFVNAPDLTTERWAHTATRLKDGRVLLIGGWNDWGFEVTRSAEFYTHSSLAPAIAQQPVAQTIASGSTVVFTVAASGLPVPAYQWMKDGVALPDVTNATLVLPNATPAHAGNYSVSVANELGTVTSAPASLTVRLGDPSRLANLSVLTSLAAGDTLTSARRLEVSARAVSNRCWPVRRVPLSRSLVSAAGCPTRP